jgi:Zn-dependent peptidase ImmA (M78 family)
VDKLPAEIVEEFTRSFPVGIDGLAKALDLRVLREELPDDISGKIERDWFNKDRFVVTINSSHARARQRFTLAHEIAHYVLHRDIIGDGIVDNALYRAQSTTDAIERQANRYAATILMPRRLVEQAWHTRGFQNAADLAIAFEVSKAVAEIRMTELGCVLWPRTTQFQQIDELPF